MIRRTLAALSLTLALSAWALGAELRPCFTPGQDCTAVIVREIDAANVTLLVQAYNFTSPPIIQALGRAKDRGVDVRAILDRSNEQPRYTGATYLANHGIPVLIDDRVAIAHNKVMVIDGQTVITGSFNFTKAAQARNAENVLIVTDARELAAAYSENWNSRAQASREYRGIERGGRL
jgi:phosphatidylserine/phosphatidylglycerophosphate/cardiolipin synthase-like enzyme